MFNFIAQFRLQLFKVVLVGFFKFFFNIGKIHYIAITKIFIGAVYTGKGLQQVMRFYYTAYVEFFKARSIKAG